MATRRDLFRGLGISAALATVATTAAAQATLGAWDRLTRVRDRLADRGWARLLSRVTDGGLDLNAADLKAELIKSVSIDRSVPGFEDFHADGVRGIEPGAPAASLLYHALASPNVAPDGIGAWPTLADLSAVEDAVYAARETSLAQLQADAGDARLGIVVYALEYRQGRDTPHGKHADIVYSRTGIARMGTVEPRWNGAARAFEPVDPDRPFEFLPTPQRFAAFIAKRSTGDAESFGPFEWVEGDEEAGVVGDGEREFWVPIHKLFDGADCLTDGPVRVNMEAGFHNEKLKRFHRHLQIQGFPTDWTGRDLENAPFVLSDDQIARLSDDAAHGPGVVAPRAAAFVNRARYRDDWLGFTVPEGWTNEPGVMYFSSGQILNVGPDETPTYEDGGAQMTDRTGPEYISLRHRLLPDGSIDNLNNHPEMWDILRAGGYKAQHYIDFSGEGWVTARVEGVPALRSRPAACLIAPPDFFPQVSQRELMNWWRNEVPEAWRDALWAVPPYSLSSRRFAANVNLPVGFSIREDDMTAIITQPTAASSAVGGEAGSSRYSGLPDHSPGYFDPGWDASQGLFYSDESEPLQHYLHNYGLGTPFVEDVKLCAALGSYWPAIAPDSARNFTPLKNAPGFLYPWPSIVPLTDEETGIADVGGRRMPWDGVNGPHIVDTPDGRRVSYADITRVDYIVLPGTMTAALLGQVDLAETKARVSAMEAVYWALGIHDPDFHAEFGDSEDTTPVIEILKAKAGWSVVSFRKPGRGDSGEVRTAERQAGARLGGAPAYRFHIYRPGEQTVDPADFKRSLVAIAEEAVVYVRNGKVLIKRGDQPWRLDDSLPSA